PAELTLDEPSVVGHGLGLVADVGAEVESGEGSGAAATAPVGEGTHQPLGLAAPGEHVSDAPPGSLEEVRDVQVIALVEGHLARRTLRLAGTGLLRLLLLGPALLLGRSLLLRGGGRLGLLRLRGGRRRGGGVLLRRRGLLDRGLLDRGLLLRGSS